MDLLGKLNEMQNQMAEMKSRLDQISVQGQAEGLTVVMTANRKISNIDIPQSLMDEGDKEQIEDLLLVAFNRALEQADSVAEAENQALTKDLLPPGFPGIS